MSPRVEKGLNHIHPNQYLCKWGEGRHWHLSYDTFPEMWIFKGGYEGWELQDGDEHLIEGAALVAPLSVLFWGKE